MNKNGNGHNNVVALSNDAGFIEQIEKLKQENLALRQALEVQADKFIKFNVMLEALGVHSDKLATELRQANIRIQELLLAQKSILGKSDHTINEALPTG